MQFYALFDCKPGAGVHDPFLNIVKVRDEAPHNVDIVQHRFFQRRTIANYALLDQWLDECAVCGSHSWADEGSETVHTEESPRPYAAANSREESGGGNARALCDCAHHDERRLRSRSAAPEQHPHI